MAPSVTRATFCDGLTAVSHEVALDLAEDALVISAPEWETLRWPYGRIALHDKFRGIFGMEATPSARLTIADETMALALRQKLHGRHRSRIDWRFAGNCLAWMAIVLAMVFVVIPSMTPLIVPHVPRTWDSYVGTYAGNYYKRIAPECDGEPGSRAMESLIGRLTAPLASPYHYHVTVINIAMVNTMSLPGGTILVFRGLLDQARDPNELAGVLSHEIGHIEHRHGMEFMVRAVATSFVLDVMTGGSGTLLYLGKQLNDLKFSRGKEHEADMFALDLMKKEGISPSGFAQFFVRLQEQQAKDKLLGDNLKFLSDHPGSPERSRLAEQSFEPGRQYQPAMNPADWAAIKTMCDGLPKGAFKLPFGTKK